MTLSARFSLLHSDLNDFLGDFNVDKAVDICENLAITSERWQWPKRNSTTPPFRMTN